MKFKIQSEKGSALLITLALMAMLFGLAVMSVDRSTDDVNMSFNQVHEDKAFYIAEAGAKKAYFYLNDSLSWRTGYGHVSYSDGEYSVRIIDSAVDSALIDTLIIRSTGSHQSSNVTVDLELAPEYFKPFKYGMFADGGIVLDRGTCTDSYNADSGNYASTMVDSLGSIGSNTSVSTSKNINIGGDVSVAKGGSISFGPGVNVTGDTTTTADSVTLDLISPTQYTWAETNSNAPAGISGTNWSYNPATKALTTGASANVVLQTGVYYFSSITTDQLTSISVAPGANVEIYVSGDVFLAQGTQTNVGGSPADFMLYMDGSNFSMNQDNDFYGVLYAPNAHLQYDQTSEFFGAAVVNTIKLDQDACFHYDRNLSKINSNKVLKYDVVAWGESY